MSRIYPSHDTTTLGKPLTSEDELEKKRKNDDYKREKRFKDFILWMAIVLTAFVAIAFVFDYITNDVTRKFVIDLIRNNAVGIVFFVLFVLGINMQKQK